MKLFNPSLYAMLATGAILLPSMGMAADDLSYGYLEGDYINLDIDQPNESSTHHEDFDNGGGGGFKFSFPLSDAFFVYGNYSDTQSDFSFVDDNNVVVPGDTDLLRVNLGAGFILPMTDFSDVVLSGGYSDIDYDHFRFGATSSSSLDDLDDDPSDGFTIDAALRSQLTSNIETSIGARYTDIEDMDNISLIGSVMFELNQHWGLNVSVDAGDDLMTWGAGIRYSY